MTDDKRLFIGVTLILFGAIGLLIQNGITSINEDEAYHSYRRAGILNAETDRIQLARLRAERVALASVLAQCAETDWRDRYNLRTVK